MQIKIVANLFSLFFFFQIIQKFSTTQASLESRKKLLKDIASENGIVLHLEEDAPLVAQVRNFYITKMIQFRMQCRN